MAHELKAPIAVITGLAETLSVGRHSLTDAQIDDCLDRISRQGRRLERLVGDLLYLSTVESSSFEVSLEPVDLARAAVAALESAPTPAQKSVELDIPEPVWALADEGRLEQVLVNLLTNAYRYGGSTVSVTVRESSDGPVITVADDGEGVPGELVPKLFQRFSRGPAVDGVNGSGLGLAISRALIDGLGGRISYEPGRPAGAVFNLTLQAVRPDGGRWPPAC